MDLKDYFGLVPLCLLLCLYVQTLAPLSSCPLCPNQRQITEQINAKLPNFQTEAKITGLLLKKPRYINI